MNKLDLGAVSAYAMAKEKGYEGTEEEFATLMAESGDNALRAEAAKNRAEEILESIPLDFQEVSQGVATLTEEIDTAFTVANLVEKAPVLETTYINVNGEMVSPAWDFFTMIIPCKPDTVYSAVIDRARFVTYYNGNNLIGGHDYEGANLNASIVPPAGCDTVKITCYYIGDSADMNKNMDAKYFGTPLELVKYNRLAPEYKVNMVNMPLDYVDTTNVRVGCVSFVFDDGLALDDEIYKAFVECGFACGFALPTNIGSEEMQRYKEYHDNGFSILAHSIDGEGFSDTTLTEYQAGEKFRQARRTLENEGFKISGWVTPSSQMNEKYIPTLESFYSYGFTVYHNEDIAEDEPYNTLADRPCRLKRRYLGTSIETLQAAVNGAADYRGFLTFYYHSRDLGTDMTIDRLKEFLRWLKNKANAYDVEVLPPDLAIRYYYRKQIPGGGGGESVQSVNGKTGAVKLSASDVGALPAEAEIVDTTARAGVAENKQKVAELTQEVEQLKGKEPEIIDLDINTNHVFRENKYDFVQTTTRVAIAAPVELNTGDTITINVGEGEKFGVMLLSKVASTGDISTEYELLGKYNSSSWNTESGTLVSDKAQYAFIQVAKVNDAEITAETCLTTATLEKVAASDDMPMYWKAHLDGKCAEIDSAMNAIGGHGDAILYFTDPHWSSNKKRTPEIASYIRANTSIKNVFCGGDIADGGERNLSKYRDAWNGIPVFTVRGNHDQNPLSNDETDIISDEEYYNLILRPIEDKATLTGKLYYHLDNKAQKIRYIFMDSGCAWTTTLDDTQINWLKERLTELDAGWSVLVMQHMVFDGNAKSGGNIAISSRGTLLINAINAVWDQLKCSIIGILTGHIHSDYSTTESVHGYPIIATSCDNGAAARNDCDPVNPAETGTVSEQLLDAVCIDTSARTIQCIRIGAGSNRTFTY